MALKDRILAELAAARGEALSGQALAQRLGVSRAAVWKAITALRAEGMPIDAVTNRGYTLACRADVLSADAVSALLGELPLRVEATGLVPSTNALVRARAAAGAAEGLVLVASGQTEGKGRAGRAFYSPAGSGVYFSLLLRPAHCAAARATLLTAMAAVAAADAAEALYQSSTGTPLPQPVQIKWVNDLLLGGKKICGILTEAALDLETGELDHAVLGVGFNLADPAGGWQAGLQTVAGSLFGAALPPVPNLRAAYTAAFLQRFWALYRRFDPAEFLPAYRARQAVLGKTVEVLATGAPPRTAQALALDDEGRLVVRYPDGTVCALPGGEVRVKPQ